MLKYFNLSFAIEGNVMTRCSGAREICRVLQETETLVFESESVDDMSRSLQSDSEQREQFLSNLRCKQINVQTVNILL